MEVIRWIWMVTGPSGLNSCPSSLVPLGFIVECQLLPFSYMRSSFIYATHLAIVSTRALEFRFPGDADHFLLALEVTPRLCSVRTHGESQEMLKTGIILLTAARKEGSGGMPLQLGLKFSVLFGEALHFPVKAKGFVSKSKLLVNWGPALTWPCSWACIPLDCV